MIVCVTPNPTVDVTMVVPQFHAGEVFRTATTLVTAGGKGINAARAINTLGVRAVAAGFLGGVNGQKMQEMVAGDAIPSAWTWISGETRSCIIIADPELGQATVINEAGPTVSAADWERLRADVQSAAEEAQTVCLNGSLPQGSPIAAYEELIRWLLGAGKTVWVDTSGKSLQAALGIAGLGIKVNGAEAGEIVGRSVKSVQEAAEAARALLERGPHSVVLTLGAAGAVMANREGVWAVRPPTIKAIDPVGSGDSFLGGLVAGLSRGGSAEEALRTGAAAGAANALILGAGYFHRSDFDDLFGRCTVERVSG
ncbi:MAG: hexose kinase [Anaerolineae bacterium]|nr:hexose kinase [Anaerolineae bacterium]